MQAYTSRRLNPPKSLSLKNALSIVRALSALMLSVMLVMMGNSLFTTLIALRADIEGYPNAMIGLMTSAYFFGFAIGTLRVGPIINRVGHIRSFAAFAAITSATMLSFLLILDPWAWVVLRIIMGAAIAGCFIIEESWLNNRATNQSRGVLLSIYMMIGYLASATGQQSLRIGDPGDFNVFLFAGILLVLAIVPVALTRATHPDPVSQPQLNLRRLFRISPTALSGCILGGAIVGSMWGLGPVYARELGFEVDQIATFMSIAVVGGLLFQLPVGRLTDRFDRRTVLLGVSVAAIAPALVLSIGSSFNPLLLFLGIGCFGGLVSTIYPISIAYANDYLNPEDVVSASAGFVLAFAMGAVVGPLAASAMMSLVGAGGLFLLTLFALATLIGLILWRMRIRQWAHVVEKESFVALPEVPAIVTDLDPRAAVDEQYDLGPDKIDIEDGWGGKSFSYPRRGTESAKDPGQDPVGKTTSTKDESSDIDLPRS